MNKILLLLLIGLVYLQTNVKSFVLEENYIVEEKSANIEAPAFLATADAPPCPPPSALGYRYIKNDKLFVCYTEKGWKKLCQILNDDDLDALYLKDVNSNRVFAGAYITGIFPIKRYNTQSALNNFWEYTMLAPGGLERYFGFTKKEVESMSQDADVSLNDLEKWYDGYRIGSEPSMFNPNSVIQALVKKKCDNYWNRMGAFEAVSYYIQMNFDGLKDTIIELLAGGECKVDYEKFGNDLNVIKN